MNTIKHLPEQVVDAIVPDLIILDEFYGVDRNIEEDLGGYVVVIEAMEDIKKLEDSRLYVYKQEAEYVDELQVGEETWIKSLFLLNSDFGVVAKVLGEKKCKLKDLARKYLQIEMDKDLQHGDNWNDELTEAHYIYAVQDVFVTEKIYKILKRQLNERGLRHVYDRENRANTIISKLNNTGVKFDYTGWEQVLRKEAKQLVKIEDKIRGYVGDVNMNSPKKLKEALDKLGVRLSGTSDDQLAMHENDHPVIPLIRKHRKKGIKIKTYGTKLKDKLCFDGRIRANWHILGAASGRMLCTQPPLQGMPSESKKFFIAEDGCKFIIADYSQIELRVLAEISRDHTLRKFFEEEVDLHVGTAKLIFNKPIEQITPHERQVAKSLNFGMIYGITEYGIRKNLAKIGIMVSLEEARLFREQFLEVYEGIQALQNQLLKSLVVKSLGGRSWECKDLSLTQRLNYPIQGQQQRGLKRHSYW